MADFHEVLFPADISYGSAGGASFKTTVFMADSGYEQRNIDWSMVRCEFDVSQGIKEVEQMESLTGFFMARYGRAYGFRFKDWNDFWITNQNIGTGDGTTTVFQFVKTYTSAQAESGQSWTYTRTLTKINWASVRNVLVGGVAKTEGSDFTVDYNTGKITFNTAPHTRLDIDGNPIDADDTSTTVHTPAAAVVIGYAEFHVPCRFDTDKLDVTQEFWNTSSWQSIPIVEVRDWGEVVEQ